MKLLLAVLLATSAISSSATAGSSETPAIEVAATVAPKVTKTDWSGFYIGGTYAAVSGNFESFLNKVSYQKSSVEGSLIGAFAGYNIHRNAMVYGAELAYSAGDTTFIPLQKGRPEIVGETVIDAKARIGRTFNDILIYGVAGKSWDTVVSQRGEILNVSGFNYGAGAQMKFGGNMIVGIEYLIRDLVTVDPDNSDINYEYLNETVTLRAGWQF